MKFLAWLLTYLLMYLIFSLDVKWVGINTTICIIGAFIIAELWELKREIRDRDE